jgi:hypothetical protein
MGFSTDLLSGSPFDDFLAPGLILFFVVGGGMLAAGVATLLRWKFADEMSFAAGAILFGWITSQVLIIDELSWLHLLMWALAALVIALSLLHRLPLRRRSISSEKA